MLATRTIDRPVTDRVAAFAALTDRHLDAAYRLAAVILGDAFEAEDAVHDAALTAWRSFGQLREPARFDAWFTRILVNQCRDRLRARRRRPVVRSIPDRAGTDAASLVGERDEVAHSLRVLEPDELIVIVLRFWQDLTIDQIADRLGVPSGTVKSRLHHALRRVQAALIAVETAP